MKKRDLIGIIALLSIIVITAALYFSTANNSRQEDYDNSEEVNITVPGLSLLGHPVFAWPDKVELRAGETKEVNLYLETRKNGPGMVIYSIFRVENSTEDDKIPMPPGLNISIEPSSFMAYPNETYNSTISIKTNPDLPRGEYALRTHIYFEDVQEGGGWMTVSVI
ncbi:MAG: hypothetical protein RBT65_11155 [Methanolobus sp.]|jgi:hypothetical protein|nr:hypothetical protein [Methanolobus sp.]